MKAKYISYQDTHAFSKLVLDYVNDEPFLKDLYGHRPDINGFRKAINEHNFKGDRQLLSSVLTEQYANCETHDSVLTNIKRLN
ncbi:MAG: bacillithiol biosynthesis BshC, partial [Chitinophagaceae bacterium]